MNSKIFNTFISTLILLVISILLSLVDNLQKSKTYIIKSAIAEQIANYNPAKPKLFELHGVLSHRKRTHPNGTKFDIFILRLDNPISLNSPHYRVKNGENEIHIFNHKALEDLDNKRITVKGEIFEGYTAWHARPLLMDVSLIVWPVRAKSVDINTWCEDFSMQLTREKKLYKKQNIKAKVIGKGRSSFYSAPIEKCKSDLFIIPNDHVTINLITVDKKWVFINYVNTKSKKEYNAWMYYKRLKTQ